MPKITEESLVQKFCREFEDRIPALANGMTFIDMKLELAEVVRELLRQAQREALRRN